MMLRTRLARLEAVEAVRSILVQYVHHMDTGNITALTDLFSDGAHFRAENEPGGTGGSVDIHGRHAIARHFEGLPVGWFRHHPATTAVDIAPGARRAVLSSYFLTSFPGGIQGGIYEGELHRTPRTQTWQIHRWQITSTWGWRAGDENFTYFDDLTAVMIRNGAPVLWNRTLNPRHPDHPAATHPVPPTKDHTGGNKPGLDEMLRRLPAAIHTDQASNLRKTIQFDSGEPTYLVIDHGTCTLHPGTASTWDIRLTAKPEHLAAVLLGETTPAAAFFRGRLKVDGDTLFAQRLLTLFDHGIVTAPSERPNGPTT